MRGHAVTWFDRANFPRDKVCGDWLTPMALHELARQGLNAEALAHQVPHQVIIRQTELVAPSGRSSRHPLDTPGRCIPRRTLDHLLMCNALQAGCTFVRKDVRRLDRQDPAWSDFDHLIDARGAAVSPTNAMGLRAYWTVPKIAPFTDRAAQVSLITDRQHLRGYGWVFPVESTDQFLRFNIGVGLWKGRERVQGLTAGPTVSPPSVTAFFERFLDSHPIPRAIARQAVEVGKRAGYPLSLGRPQAQVSRDGVFLIGDAAGLADPLTGDGIGNALASGRNVAEIIDAQETDPPSSALSGKQDVTQRWQDRFDRHFRPEFRRAVVLRSMLTPTMSKELAACVLNLGPQRLRSAIHRTLFGQTPYRDLF
jgi:flavin-dependent dehydrogenase